MKRLRHILTLAVAALCVVDVVAVAGLGTWTYFLFFRRKKKEA